MRYALLLIASLLFVGCETTHVRHHSTITVPYQSDATSTQMDLVTIEGGQQSSGSLGFIVLVAEDGDSDPYVLLAPMRANNTSEYRIRSARIDRAVPLSKPEVDTLSQGLDRTLEMLSGPDLEEEGEFYEYIYAPEQNIDRVSTRVVEWYPALRFTAARTEEGTTAELILGDSPEQSLQYRIEIEEREALEDFRTLLRNAYAQL